MKKTIEIRTFQEKKGVYMKFLSYLEEIKKDGRIKYHMFKKMASLKIEDNIPVFVVKSKIGDHETTAYQIRTLNYTIKN